MKVYLGADHRGFALKERVARWLFDWGYGFEDLGAQSLEPGDDYPVYAQKVASLVSKEPEARGLLFCGSGVGVEVVANKFDGVRAGVGKSAKQVEAGRRDDDMNVLVIAADFTSETEVKDMVKTFLETKFDQALRHKKRLQDISKIEANN